MGTHCHASISSARRSSPRSRSAGWSVPAPASAADGVCGFASDASSGLIKKQPSCGSPSGPAHGRTARHRQCTNHHHHASQGERFPYSNQQSTPRKAVADSERSSGAGGWGQRIERPGGPSTGQGGRRRRFFPWTGRCFRPCNERQGKPWPLRCPAPGHRCPRTIQASHRE